MHPAQDHRRDLASLTMILTGRECAESHPGALTSAKYSSPAERSAAHDSVPRRTGPDDHAAIVGHDRLEVHDPVILTPEQSPRVEPRHPRSAVPNRQILDRLENAVARTDRQHNRLGECSLGPCDDSCPCGGTSEPGFVSQFGQGIDAGEDEPAL